MHVSLVGKGLMANTKWMFMLSIFVVLQYPSILFISIKVQILAIMDFRFSKMQTFPYNISLLYIPYWDVNLLTPKY